MIGESMHSFDQHCGGWAYPNYVNGTCAIPLNYADPGNGYNNWPNRYSFQSKHDTGANFCFADGAVRYVTNGVNQQTYRGLATIRGDETEPVIVKLGPVGTLTGRLLDTDGNALTGATVSIYARGMIARELYRFATPTGKPVVTDKNGRFTLTGVVPGVLFSLQVQKGDDYFAGKPRLGQRQLKPGERLNLGDRTMESQR